MSLEAVGVLALLAVALLLRAAQRAFRRNVRAELKRYVLAHHPHLNVTTEAEHHVMVHTPHDGEVRLNLHALYQHASGPGMTDEAARQPAYRKSVRALEEALELRRPSLDKHGDRILPRLMRPEFFRERPEGSVIKRAIPGVELSVVYVLNGSTGATYLTTETMRTLGLTEETLHQRALTNLRSRMPDRMVEEALGGKTCTLNSGDGYDAVRVLLVPELLAPGQELAALIPERDVLHLEPVPAQGDWTVLRKRAHAAAGPVLLQAPLRVTRDGFEQR